MSMIVAVIAIPIQVARHKKGRAGLKRALVLLLLYEMFYAFALLYLVGRV